MRTPEAELWDRTSGGVGDGISQADGEGDGDGENQSLDEYGFLIIVGGVLGSIILFCLMSAFYRCCSPKRNSV